MSSKEFQEFLITCIGIPRYASYVDEKTLLKLKGEEKSEAIKLLLKELETTEHTNSIQAAGYLKIPEAAKILKKRLVTGFRFRMTYIETAVTLWKIEKYDKSFQMLLDIYNSPQAGEYEKGHAILYLECFGLQKHVLNTLFEIILNDSAFSSTALNCLEKIINSDNQISHFINEIQQINKFDNLSGYRKKKLIELKKIIYKRFSIK
ncbi:MAG: hypothetical protein JNK81_08865 [Anaerolineales bacterium]|nr:hypothetical protein [Anaerolineales bacterium]